MLVCGALLDVFFRPNCLLNNALASRMIRRTPACLSVVVVINDEPLNDSASFGTHVLIGDNDLLLFIEIIKYGGFGKSGH